MSTTLHVDGLVASVGEQALANLFSQFGQVLSVQMYLRGTATSSGSGTVEMEAWRTPKRPCRRSIDPIWMDSWYSSSSLRVGLKPKEYPARRVC